MMRRHDENNVLGDLDMSSTGSSSDHAPVYRIPTRTVSAIEHPMLIKDHDKAIKTFGSNFNFAAVLDHESAQLSVPLYPRYDNPVVRPIISHNAPSHNVLLKIEVPRRTGRKRKRGSDGPWLEPGAERAEPQHMYGESRRPRIMSQKGLDEPNMLQRKLQDNIGKYKVEAVGLIRNTHRYRGLVDYQYSTVNAPFMNNIIDKVLPGDVAQMRKFTMEPGTANPPNVEIVPPPVFSHMNLPFHYNYAQNPYVRTVHREGGATTINLTARANHAGYFIAHDTYPAPNAPSRNPNVKDPQMAAAIVELSLAFEERPIWTRRSLTNRLAASARSGEFSENIIKHAMPFFAYQFKGGPWRDAVVRYGVDPRTDPECRIYQTLMFKTRRAEAGNPDQQWASVRRSEASTRKWRRAPTLNAGGPKNGENDANSHIFDGQTFCTDGKVWQVCDITDPLLVKIFANAQVRSECEVSGSGWYRRGLWAKARAIMKCKMLAIAFGRTLSDQDFTPALALDDGTPEPTPATGQPVSGASNVRLAHVNVPLPDLKLTEAEMAVIRGHGQSRFSTAARKRKKTSHGFSYRVPLINARSSALGKAATSSGATTPSQMPAEDSVESGGPDTPLRSVEDVINEDDDEEDDEGDEEGEGDEDEDGYFLDRDEFSRDKTGDPASKSPFPNQQRTVRFDLPNQDNEAGHDSAGPAHWNNTAAVVPKEMDTGDHEDDEEVDEADGYMDSNIGDEFATDYEEERGFSSAEDY
ncbi:hypothetical protein MCOR25_007591 [Pyricularia grisea]|nr:hypothetical protein MCOR25_007591 [Pyricularia grisea]